MVNPKRKKKYEQISFDCSVLWFTHSSYAFRPCITRSAFQYVWFSRRSTNIVVIRSDISDDGLAILDNTDFSFSSRRLERVINLKRGFRKKNRTEDTQREFETRVPMTYKKQQAFCTTRIKKRGKN